MNCAACGTAQPTGKRFCADCGAPLPVACTACGSANSPQQRFCGHCGQALPSTTPRETAPAQSAAPTVGITTDAERRQLTVMFCDLVGSTALATQLDPEDWQALIRSYHTAVAAAVTPYEGHAAQLLGDGVLVYFGYPRAHEDDAGRAVRAGLAVLPAVAALKHPGGVELQTRIGIATGLVVVGVIGEGTPAAEHSASGETPNLAARLQALAGPGEIVVSEQTRSLLGASFELSPLGSVALKGFAAPVPAWRVQGERGHASRFDAQHERELSACIGRDSEVALLLDRWALARDGEAQVVLLSGEAGIGKSRICQALRERLSGGPSVTVLLQCSPYFQGSALYPVVQHLQRAAGIASADAAALRRQKLEHLGALLPPELLSALLRTMGLPDEANGDEGHQTPQQHKTRTLRALVELLRDSARQQPVLLLVEDAHWIDPTTEELIAQMVDQLRESRLLTLVTSRPEASPALGSPAHLTRLALNRLGQRQCAALIDAVALGKPLPAEVQAEIIRKTDGVPLFVEELTKTVLQSGLLEESAEGWRLVGALPALASPSTLQDSLMARLDRLAPAKDVAQAGAAIGREFSYRLLAAVLESTAARLDEALAELVSAELLIKRGSPPETSYMFKHALVRDTAYNSMLKSQRVLRHRQIAAALEQLEPDTAAAHPELLAHHHQEAGDAKQAIEQWVAAGKLTVARGANREAAASFERALALLETLPETPRTMSDALDIHLALGSIQFGLHGDTPQVEQSYRNALALAERLEDSPKLFPALWGLNYVQFFRGEYANCVLASERLLEVAMKDGDSGHLIEAHHSMWISLVQIGRPLEALVHLDQGDALYDPQKHAPLRYQYAGHDPGACCSQYKAVSSWLLGFPDRALNEAGRAIERIVELKHPMTNILLMWFAWVYFQAGDRDTAAMLGERLVRIGEQHGFHAWSGPAVVLTELAPSRQSSPKMLRHLHERIVASESSKGMKLLMCTVLVELCAAAGDIELARNVLTPMLATSESIHRADWLRAEGALLLQDANPDSVAAERCFHNAIAVAREQGAKSFELRAATSLAELWQQQGELGDARRLLGDIYGWFTEGFETGDLRRAKALLDELQFDTAP